MSWGLAMRFRFADRKLKRMYEQPGETGGYSRATVSALRLRVQFIADAADERDFYAFKSLHYEKRKGKRAHQRSMRLNDQFRLILEIEKGTPGNTVVVIGIEDYRRVEEWRGGRRLRFHS